MNKPLSESIKTIAQGALGSMTFGIYHQFTTNKLMELNNEKVEIQTKYFIDKMETQHNKEINELNEKVERLLKNQKNRWW